MTPPGAPGKDPVRGPGRDSVSMAPQGRALATTFGPVTWEPTSNRGPTDIADGGVEPELNAEELRVLACLIEKGHTTPDQYPLSTNALAAACSQKTSRDPVVDYSTQLVDRTLQLLRDGGWARSKRAAGERTFKHRHVVDERLGLGVPEQAVVAVLALRGPQSPGELKTRTERYHPFADLDEVEAVLAGLATRPEPLARNVGRAPGQSQDRWIQLLGPTPGGATPGAGDVEVSPAAAGAPTPAAGVGPGPEGEATRSPEPGELDRLRQRVAELEARMARLEDELGL